MNEHFDSPELNNQKNAEENHVEPSQYPDTAPDRKSKTIPILAICFALIGSILGSTFTWFFWGSPTKQNNISESGSTITHILESRRKVELETHPIDVSKMLTPAQVYAANVNATVGITTAITTNFWGYQTTSAASGSGFILSSDGYILTNYHVIENSSSITVSLFDGTVYDAELVGYDESNDIAVLKVNTNNLVPVILGTSEQLNVGDSVVAIGNPLGELTFSLTAGTVSAKDRKVTLSSSVTMELIQTDCAINSGNSGGALFNLYGEVIGITNAKYSSSSASQATIDNIGFAIPIDNILHIVESIIEKGYVSKPYLGIIVSDISPETQLYGIPKGAAVQSVAEASPAAKAGLQPGDIITHSNHVPVGSSSTLVDIVSKRMPGDSITLSVYRQGKTIEITITIEEQIHSALENAQQKETPKKQHTNTEPLFPFGNY